MLNDELFSEFLFGFLYVIERFLSFFDRFSGFEDSLAGLFEFGPQEFLFFVCRKHNLNKVQYGRGIIDFYNTF